MRSFRDDAVSARRRTDVAEELRNRVRTVLHRALDLIAGEHLERMRGAHAVPITCIASAKRPSANPALAAIMLVQPRTI